MGMMVEAVRGEVVRFDQVKGYGFVAPSGGGEDVFLHANDLLDDKHLIRPGVIVEFVVESGEKGLKASAVRVVQAAPVSQAEYAPSGPVPAQAVGAIPRAVVELDDGLVDVLTEADFLREVTEVLLRTEPALTGPQVLSVRRAFAQVAGRYGWVTG